MSGGYFDYAQYRISQIAEDIDTVIFNNGSSQLDEYGDRLSCDLPPDIIEEFKRAANAMRLAYIYAQRCDWLLSGDDGEDSFRARLRKDLAELRQYEVEMVSARDYDALQSLNTELLEAVDVVAHVATMGFGQHYASGIGEPIGRCIPGEPLMTVAQHQRISAAMTAECERLRSERDAFRDSRNYLIEEISSHLSEIAELREALRDTARWIERLPVQAQGAIRQLERIDAALTRRANAEGDQQ